MPQVAFFQKKFVPLEDAKVNIMTHALHYGTACFEGIRGNWNEEEQQIYLFRIKEHYERLQRSCRIIKIKLAFSVEELCRITVDLVKKNGLREDIYIRPLAYKSSLTIGVRLHGLDDDFFLFVAPFGNYLDVTRGIKCCVSSWRRIDDNIIPPRAKVTGLYVNSALAKTEAFENGYDEAILLSQNGHVSEGSGENIFIINNGKLITPPATDNILLGITRDTIIQVAKEEFGIETEERSVDRSELYLANECFLTGTAAHVTPVLEIDHRPVGDGQIGKISKELQNLYFDIVRGKNKKYSHWCTPAYGKKTVAGRR